MQNLDQWKLDHRNRRDVLILTYKDYSFEIREVFDYEWHGWELFLVENKTGKEQRLHMEYNKGEYTITADTSIDAALNRVKDFLESDYRVLKEVLEGNLAA